MFRGILRFSIRLHTLPKPYGKGFLGQQRCTPFSFCAKMPEMTHIVYCAPENHILGHFQLTKLALILKNSLMMSIKPCWSLLLGEPRNLSIRLSVNPSVCPSICPVIKFLFVSPLLYKFYDGITSIRFELASSNLVWWFVMMIRFAYCSRKKIRHP